VDLYKKMVSDFPGMQIIASGGIASADELHRLNAAGVSGAIIGKALYEGRIKLEELNLFLC
jgi:phosphoribosylformimino-5-aminoimidazole carboxamide ribotide isomerase